MDARARTGLPRRRRLQQTASPPCNTDMTNWPADTVAACNAQVSGGMVYEVSYTARRRIQLCGSGACMKIERLMKIDNPTECSYVYQGTAIRLYADVVTPLEQTCREVAAANETETPSSTGSSGGDTAASSSSVASDPAQSVGGEVSATSAPPSTTSRSSSSATGAAVATVTGVVVVLLVGIWLFLRRRRQQSQSVTKSSADSTATTTTSSYRSYGDHIDDYAPLLLPLINWKMISSDLTDVKQLGCGSHAAVHLVTLDGGRKLASKRLPTDQFSKHKLTTLIAEAQLASTLQHPSIVSFVGVAWNSLFDFQALFEYMPNGDLRSHLDITKPQQPEPWTRAKVATVLQIAEALAYLQSFNPPIVHRNLTARNVLLDAEMNAKLSNFSVARSHSEHETTASGWRSGRWLAPEVIVSGKCTAQSDIYSFGMILVEIDTHGLPYKEETQLELMLLHQVTIASLIPTISPTCQPAIKSLIEGCLSADAGDRPNALRLTYGLRQILKELVSE